MKNKSKKETNSLIKIKVSKIKYDTEGQDVKLPKSMIIEMSKDEFDCYADDIDDLKDEIGDIITDKVDFCVLDFNYVI